MECNVDFVGYDLIWKNKPDLPIANEENRKIEEILNQKKIEMEQLKVVLENNINKGKNIKEHFNDLCQTLSYKQQLYKSKEHEFEMEMHVEKVIEREQSRLQQEMKALDYKIITLRERQERREAAVAEQTEKKNKLRTAIQWDEESLLQYLEKSAQMEKDNMAILKYTSEDDSRINELGMANERLSKEVYDRKSALEDANTEVLIVQTEMDSLQGEFHKAYSERTNLISNWEKVIQQIQQRNKEVNKLSQRILHLRDEATSLQRVLREQEDLLETERMRNDGLERDIAHKDSMATSLKNQRKGTAAREEDFKAQLSTVRNVLNSTLYQKQLAQNSMNQLERQVTQKKEKLEEAKRRNRRLEAQAAQLESATAQADHFTKELEAVLAAENARHTQVQRDLESRVKDILHYSHEVGELKAEEKLTENRTKNCQAEIRILKSKIAALDQARINQESESYEIESTLERLRNRVKKMSGGSSNEEDRRRVEKERSSLLATLEDRKASLAMLTEEVKLMVYRISVAQKQLESYKKYNTELTEKIKFLDFYIINSQKSLKSSVSRKQELLIQECLERFQLKKFQNLLNDKNKSVASLQKNKLEMETLMRARVSELHHCRQLLEAEARTEEDECSVVRRKLHEFCDKVDKLKTRYQIILESLGVEELGEGAETEMVIKAENEKRDLEDARDQLLSELMKDEDELSSLKNTVWMVNAANEQFRQMLHPPGVNAEDGEELKRVEADGNALLIEKHSVQSELRSLQRKAESKEAELKKEADFCAELREALEDREAERSTLTKELDDLKIKMQRAQKSQSRLSVDVRNKGDFVGAEEDIRIHLLREIRRTVSDLLFSAVEEMPEISAKVQELFEQAHLPLPSRVRSSSSLRTLSSFRSNASSRQSTPVSTARSSKALSVVTLGS